MKIVSKSFMVPKPKDDKCTMGIISPSTLKPIGCNGCECKSKCPKDSI